MRAIVLDGEGGVTVTSRPEPEATGDRVRVRVHGAGLNRADLLQRAGRYPAPAGAPADIPGLEFAGVVDALGPEVEALAVGDRVFGIAGGGAQAELLTVPESSCAAVPDGLDLVEMGGVPEAFVTAHDAIVTQAGLAASEWLVVHAVGSGVGTAAVQLGATRGSRVVGTSRSPDKLERCRPLGMAAGIQAPHAPDGTLDVDALAAALRDATEGGLDVSCNLVGGPYVEADVAAARPGGRIVLVGTLAGGSARLRILTAMAHRLRLFGTVLRSRSEADKAAAIAGFAADVVPGLASGALAPVVDSVVPLDDAPAAYDRLASDVTLGTIVLDAR